MDLKSVLLKKSSAVRIIILAIYRNFHQTKKNVFTKMKKADYGSKVFCIGYNKTGTTSLGRSLKMLGYDHSSYDPTVYQKHYVRNYNVAKIIEYTSKYESFDDLPWNMIDLIPILDKTFPGSKFIYLDRDEESWRKSVYHWYFKKFGKYPNLEKYSERYRKHREFVLEYFQNRVGTDLIILNIKEEDGFQKLARFLGKDAPMKEFPHFNKTTSMTGKTI